MGVTVLLSARGMPRRQRSVGPRLRFRPRMEIRRVMRRWGGDGWAPVAGAAVVAVALTLVATAHWGPGAEPDSVTYLAAARHLRAGHGFADIDGTPLTLFPPVFPAAVAALEWLGLGALPAARFLN